MRKAIAIYVISLIVVVGATWYGKGLLDEKEFEQRLLKAKHDSDTTTQIIYTPRKKENVKIKNPQNTIKEHFKAADSVFQIGFKKGYDSASYLFAQKTVPEDTTIIFNTEDTLHHIYTPLTGIAVYDFKPFPSKQIKTTIIDTVYVSVQEKCETPWYNQWYVRDGAIAVILYLVFAK